MIPAPAIKNQVLPSRKPARRLADGGGIDLPDLKLDSKLPFELQGPAQFAKNFADRVANNVFGTITIPPAAPETLEEPLSPPPEESALSAYAHGGKVADMSKGGKVPTAKQPGVDKVPALLDAPPGGPAEFVVPGDTVALLDKLVQQAGYKGGLEAFVKANHDYAATEARRGQEVPMPPDENGPIPKFADSNIDDIDQQNPKPVLPPAAGMPRPDFNLGTLVPGWIKTAYEQNSGRTPWAPDNKVSETSAPAAQLSASPAPSVSVDRPSAPQAAPATQPAAPSLAQAPANQPPPQLAQQRAALDRGLSENARRQTAEDRIMRNYGNDTGSMVSFVYGGGNEMQSAAGRRVSPQDTQRVLDLQSPSYQKMKEYQGKEFDDVYRKYDQPPGSQWAQPPQVQYGGSDPSQPFRISRQNGVEVIGGPNAAAGQEMAKALDRRTLSDIETLKQDRADQRADARNATSIATAGMRQRPESGLESLAKLFEAGTYQPAEKAVLYGLAKRGANPMDLQMLYDVLSQKKIPEDDITIKEAMSNPNRMIPIKDNNGTVLRTAPISDYVSGLIAQELQKSPR